MSKSRFGLSFVVVIVSLMLTGVALAGGGGPRGGNQYKLYAGQPMVFTAEAGQFIRLNEIVTPTTGSLEITVNVRGTLPFSVSQSLDANLTPVDPEDAISKNASVAGYVIMSDIVWDGSDQQVYVFQNPAQIELIANVDAIVWVEVAKTPKPGVATVSSTPAPTATPVNTMLASRKPYYLTSTGGKPSKDADLVLSQEDKVMYTAPSSGAYSVTVRSGLPFGYLASGSGDKPVMAEKTGRWYWMVLPEGTNYSFVPTGNGQHFWASYVTDDNTTAELLVESPVNKPVKAVVVSGSNASGPTAPGTMPAAGGGDSPFASKGANPWTIAFGLGLILAAFAIGFTVIRRRRTAEVRA